MEFASPVQTMNGNFCCDDLRWLRENVQRQRSVKWRNNYWALHHDNLPAHMLALVRQLLTSTKTIVIPHPPCSPDLAPCDFFLFTKMKLKLRGRRFENIDEIEAELQGVMKMLTQSDFQLYF
jgi:hypothetical protein